MTRYHDEILLRALDLLRRGLCMSAVAKRLDRDPSNLTKALRAVLRDDLQHDDPLDVIQHYPSNLVIPRVR